VYVANFTFLESKKEEEKQPPAKQGYKKSYNKK
jgi:hypothetical protein